MSTTMSSTTPGMTSERQPHTTATATAAKTQHVRRHMYFIRFFLSGDSKNAPPRNVDLGEKASGPKKGTKRGSQKRRREEDSG